MNSVLAVILAGGQSRRMGQDKAALPFAGGTMLTKLVEEYQKWFPVAVSVGQAGRYDTAGAEELVDLSPGQGPLAGLQTAFRKTDAETIFLTATDLPLATGELSYAVLSRMEPESDACIIRRKDGKNEPLFGFYRRSCLAPAEECLAEGRRSFKGLYQKIRVQYVEEGELPDFDLSRLLVNLNTPEDYQAVYSER